MENNNLWDERSPINPMENDKRVLIIEANGQKFIGVPAKEWGRINAELEELRAKHSVSMTVDEANHTTTTKFGLKFNHEKFDAYLDLEALKHAVDSGKTIVDDNGNEMGKTDEQYYYRRSDLKMAHAVKVNEWEGVWSFAIVTKGWHIKPESKPYSWYGMDVHSKPTPEASNHEIVALLGMGKIFESSDGKVIRMAGEQGIVFMDNPRFLIPWVHVVEGVLNQHKGWTRV